MSENKSIYTSIKLYKKMQNIKKDLQVMCDTKYPDFLVPIAYENLLKTQTQIPVHYLNAQGIRKLYILKLLIANRNEFIYNTDKYIDCIYDYTIENGTNKQFPNNLAKYTQKYLCNEYYAYFLFWWKNLNSVDNIFEEYIKEYKFKKIDRMLIHDLLDRINFSRYANFLISNNFECSEFYKHPLYQIKKLVELLETDDILTKRAISKTRFYYMFRDIIECNLKVYDIDAKIVYIEHVEIETYAKKNCVELQKFDGKNLPEYLLKMCNSFIDNDTDSLYIRNILCFFKKLEPSKDWHYYFVKRDQIQSYDHFYINYILFDILNYDYSFTKDDLTFIDKFLTNITNDKILHMYFLSAKNPKYKNALSNELEKYCENDFDANYLISENYFKEKYSFFCNSILEKQLFSNRKSENSNQLDLGIKNKTILFLMLIRIGANNFAHIFDFYFSTNQLIFFSALNVYITNNHLEYETYKNLIENVYDTISKDDLNPEQNIFKLKFFDLFSHDLNKPCKYFVDNLSCVNIEILQNFTMDSIFDCFESQSEAIQYMLSAKERHVFTNIKNNLLYETIFENNTTESFDSKFATFLGEFVNFCAEKNANIKTIKHNVIVPQNEVKSADTFLIELLYKNKDINQLLNTFYNNKDVENKVYLPRAWRIYFKRNKICDINQLFTSKKSTINQIHLLCICAALYVKENKEIIYNYVKNVKNTNQDLLFYKFVFLMYALHNKSEESRCIFDDCKKHAISYENRLLVTIISYNYNLDIDFNVEEDTKIIIESCGDKNEKQKYTEFAKIFTTQEHTEKEKTVYDAIRIMDNDETVSYKDKEKLHRMIYSCLNKNPSFIIQTLKNIDKLETLDWKPILNYIERNEYTSQIIRLIKKHYKHCNFNVLIEALKNNTQYYKHKFLVDMLSKNEIEELIASRTFCNIEFFNNIDKFELYGGIKHLGSDTYYHKNHYEILDVYSKKCAYDNTLLNKQDLYYCQLKLLEYKYFDSVNWKILEEPMDVPYDYVKLLQRDTIQYIATICIKYKQIQHLKVLEKILLQDEQNYYLPCFLNTYKNIIALQNTNLYKQYAFLLD